MVSSQENKKDLPYLHKDVILCPSCIEGVDKLDWTDGFAFNCYGAHIAVRVNNPQMMERLQSILPPHSKPSKAMAAKYLYSFRDGDSVAQAANSRIRRFHLLYLNTNRILRTQNLEDIWTNLESALHFNVAIAAQKKIFVHAGVVGWKGKAILIPGRSMSGKSSLVAALVKAGATYYSDEYAVLDEKGRVHPFAKSLSLRNSERKKVSAEELGGTVATKAVPVGKIVSTRYEPGARWQPRAMTPGQGVFELLDNTVVAQQRPAEALSFLEQSVSSATIVKSKRGNADELAQHLLS